MHIQTHILSGWVVANVLPLGPRERFLCLAVAAIPDLDGLGILVSQDLYWDLHHKLGHNVFFFGVIAMAAALLASKRRLAVLVACFALGWLHFALDYLGSGPGWGLFPLWPVSDVEVKWEGAWPFFSWQNLSAFFALLVVTIGIAWKWSRTPLEWVMPGLDRQLVTLLSGLHRRRLQDGRREQDHP